MLGVRACPHERATGADFPLLRLGRERQPRRQWRVEHLLARDVRRLWAHPGATNNVSACLSCRSASDTGQGFAPCCCAAMSRQKPRAFSPGSVTDPISSSISPALRSVAAGDTDVGFTPDSKLVLDKSIIT